MSYIDVTARVAQISSELSNLATAFTLKPSAATPALLRYISFLQHQAGVRTMVTVAIPETVPTRWWHPLVHNYFAWPLKWILLFRPRTAVTSVPNEVRD